MNNEYLNHIIDCEVLIIGGGLAGALAAYSCCKAGINPTIVSKGKLCWSGATAVCGGNAITICCPEDDKGE